MVTDLLNCAWKNLGRFIPPKDDAMDVHRSLKRHFYAKQETLDGASNNDFSCRGSLKRPILYAFSLRMCLEGWSGQSKESFYKKGKNVLL